MQEQRIAAGCNASGSYSGGSLGVERQQRWAKQRTARPITPLPRELPRSLFAGHWQSQPLSLPRCRRFAGEEQSGGAGLVPVPLRPPATEAAPRPLPRARCWWLSPLSAETLSGSREALSLCAPRNHKPHKALGWRGGGLKGRSGDGRSDLVARSSAEPGLGLAPHHPHPGKPAGGNWIENCFVLPGSREEAGGGRGLSSPAR